MIDAGPCILFRRCGMAMRSGAHHTVAPVDQPRRLPYVCATCMRIDGAHSRRLEEAFDPADDHLGIRDANSRRVCMAKTIPRAPHVTGHRPRMPCGLEWHTRKGAAESAILEPLPLVERCKQSFRHFSLVRATGGECREEELLHDTIADRIGVAIPPRSSNPQRICNLIVALRSILR